MKDFRFTGHINADYIDVTFRTDAINSTDTNFNITQIQEGAVFKTTGKTMYDKYFAGQFFKRVNTTYKNLYDFAITNGLNLRMINTDGTTTSLIHTFSNSSSAYN